MLTAVFSAEAKTTYIPTYASYIHIVSGMDTVAVENNLMSLELAESNFMD